LKGAILTMGSLKDSWKTTGVGLGHAFRDLGKSIVKSAAVAAEKVDNWANSDEKEEATKNTTENNNVEIVAEIEGKEKAE